MLIKRKQLDLNKQKSAAVVSSVLLRKQLYLTWSKMSQRCLHREEINAVETTWLLGNENPRCTKRVGGEGEGTDVDNYLEILLIFCLFLPCTCIRSTCVLEILLLRDSVDLPLGYHSILLVSFGFRSCLFRKTAKGRWYIQTSEGSSEALSIVFLLQTWEGR